MASTRKLPISSSQSEDDWSSISDPIIRKRVQNRLAQRNYRKNLKSRMEELERLATVRSDASSSLKSGIFRFPSPSSRASSVKSVSGAGVPQNLSRLRGFSGDTVYHSAAFTPPKFGSPTRHNSLSEDSDSTPSAAELSAESRLKSTRFTTISKSDPVSVSKPYLEGLGNVASDFSWMESSSLGDVSSTSVDGGPSSTFEPLSTFCSPEHSDSPWLPNDVSIQTDLFDASETPFPSTYSAEWINESEDITSYENVKTSQLSGPQLITEEPQTHFARLVAGKRPHKTWQREMNAPVTDGISLVHRLDLVLESVSQAGFDGIESALSQYYTCDFSSSSKLASAQRLSRNRKLPAVLSDLRDSSLSWSAWESQAYENEIMKSAERILINELETAMKNPQFEACLACPDNFQGSGDLVRREVPNLWSLVESLSTHGSISPRYNIPKVLASMFAMSLRQHSS